MSVDPNAATREPENPKRSRVPVDNSTSTLYGMAFLGAAVYYLQHATSFWDGALGVLKAIFWPGVLMYRILEMLKL